MASSAMDLREDERTAGTDPEAAAAPLQDAGGHGAEILASSSGGPPVGDAHGEGPAAPPGPAQEPHRNRTRTAQKPHRNKQKQCDDHFSM